MPSGDSDTAADGEEPLEPPSPQQSSYALHSTAFSGMPMHVYPFPHALLPQQPLRSKRRQVKNACTNCQKACKKCDDARPCLRCVKYGISEECVDSLRKERKKGIKRGPYKKRDGKDRAGSSVETADVPTQGPVPASNMTDSPPPSGGQPVGPYLPIGYPPGFYGQYAPMVAKQGEPAPMYSSPPYYLTSVPQHVQPQLQDPEAHAYHHGFYQAAVITPMPYPHPQYAGQDGAPIPNHYPVYGTPVYQKQHPDGHSEMVNEGHELLVDDKQD